MTDDDQSFDAHRCPNGHLSYPGHTRCPDCGEKQTETVDLADRTATVVTWTTSNATPPGVREPNPLGIARFGEVQLTAQLADDDLEPGEDVVLSGDYELREGERGPRLERA